MTWAYGKAILLGEHAVVHGHPALAGAIDCTLRCTLVQHSQGLLRLKVPGWNVDVSSTDDHPLAEALRALLAHLHAQDLAAEIAVDTWLPPRAGLGSSAALSVALTRAIVGAMGRVLSDEEIEASAMSAEQCFHQNPSGVDVALATRGGLGLFVRGQGLQRIQAAPLQLAVGLSLEPRRTADMVAKVAAASQAEPEITAMRLAELGLAARAGAHLVMQRDLASLGALMLRAHRTLADLGVSTPRLDELVLLAQSAGALGAKLTGAGGGGAVIALLPEPQRGGAVLDAWRAAGYHGFTCNLGVCP